MNKWLFVLLLASAAVAAAPRAHVSPSTAANVIEPRGGNFCDDLSAINVAFPSLMRHAPNYWAECRMRPSPLHVRAGFVDSDDHAAFCQSLYLLSDKYTLRFNGLDLNQWPFTPCLGFLLNRRGVN